MEDYVNLECVLYGDWFLACLLLGGRDGLLRLVSVVIIVVAIRECFDTL